jgi:CRISPR-associated protein Csm3
MTARINDFHRLTARLRLTGKLVTSTALRIGSGDAGFDGVDLPVLKDAGGAPFIPGASLKGALRSTIEALVRGADRRAVGLWACDPLADKDTPLVAKSCGHHERGDRLSVDLDAHCAVCRLFGSHVVASHVRFCDARLLRSASDREAGRMPVEIRDGVSIDRDLRRVYGSHKFDFEVVSPGAMFALEVFVENPQPWLMGLLAMGLDQLAEGFTALGGFTSRGLGRVSFTWSGISRVTAAALLRNEPALHTTGAAIAAEMGAWRDALATRYQETA